jgi:hypothetical protein
METYKCHGDKALRRLHLVSRSQAVSFTLKTLYIERRKVRSILGRRLCTSHGWYGRGECLFRVMSGIIPEKLVYLLFYVKGPFLITERYGKKRVNEKVMWQEERDEEN